ncbi:MAG: DNA adenine methylase [Clostridiales bacterium]|jgi:DNA adenine methylase|nr:DNA adenine methylase [Clostridiales bacterium]
MKSPIKWTGGKKREIPYFLPYIPDNFKIYIEPFFGGGALFWHLRPESAIINDINEDLMNFYRVLRNNYDSLKNILLNYEFSKDFFDKLVDKLNNKEYSCPIERAAIFYYLNKTSFSGKWRVNREGHYNNTWGNYKRPNYKKLDRKYSELLKGVSIQNTDYTHLMEEYKSNSDAFIFLDPPYLNCDAMYTANQDFINIYDYIYNYMANCESKVMLIVKGDKYITNLFEKYIIDTYTVNYSHNAKSQTKNKHLIITNYHENPSSTVMNAISL